MGIVWKSNHTANDVFSLTLVTLKNSGNWEFLARMIKMKVPTFEIMILSYNILAVDRFYEKTVIRAEQGFTMSNIFR